MSKGICVTATMKVMKKSRIKNGYIVLHGEEQGPAVATGTTVTSANSSPVLGEVKPAAKAVRLLCMPVKITIKILLENLRYKYMYNFIYLVFSKFLKKCIYSGTPTYE